MRALLVFCLLVLTGCSGSSDSKPPEQRAGAEAPQATPTLSVIKMNDPDVKAYIVKDVSDGLDPGGWRWTFDRPELRFLVKTTDGVHAVADFSIADATMKDTGPVTVSFFVNGKLLGTEKYSKSGSYHFDKPVPADLLTAGKLATFAMRPEPIWISPTDKQHLGLILIRAGFIS
ncbi:MAG: hypothetical protein M3Z09_10030 [Acidobacteriota bacterium]|nr:hypothetical protein [Acidobacteriota bacterium]